MDKAEHPEILHKIMPAKYGSDVLPFLSNGLIRFTQPGAMNDPLETRSFVDVTTFSDYKAYVDFWFQAERQKLWRPGSSKNEIKRLELPLHAARSELLEEFKSNPDMVISDHWGRIYESRDKMAGILSLTENVNSSAMWSHYASRHTGVALGFDAHAIAKLASPLLGFSELRPVEYEDKVSQMVMNFGMDELPHNHFLRKSTDWKYESEWRILVEFDERKNNKLVKTGLLDANGYPINLVRLGKHLVKEIRIGMYADYETVTRVLAFRDASKRPIKVFRMRQSSNYFGLEAVPL